VEAFRSKLGKSGAGGSGNGQKALPSAGGAVCLWRRPGRHRRPRSGARNSAALLGAARGRTRPRTPGAGSWTTPDKL